MRRGDLARAVRACSTCCAGRAAAAPALTDMSREQPHYYAAARVVAAGLMDLTPAGAFEAWRPVSGREAVDVIDGLVRLVGP